MSKKKIPYKIYLEENEMPTQWYNVRADMKNKPAPLLNPATLKPMTAEELGHVFCDELVKQELDDTNPYIDIPQEIRDFTAVPSVTTGESILSGKKLGSPQRSTINLRETIQVEAIKLNSAIAQAYYARSRD